ncbi:ABC transporter related protein [Caldicellulosiruptor acetigenus I77R1B]|uniref:ABC transporter related protein n=2 Tax=Caldicellulosiruptor acetigenus TaxID=301953 RepID=G2PVS3_9FIRM|nr:ABC transporter ATP-binding protein [Caldicellulosiruptor acetigenus]ADQ41769.1 ABC transporter related protein [Caldicellulosiruptor acetigenus I77R1B]AEM72817.1 ABC transporter related protein [Caldicellulosiruptor acetigenus 6A]
MIELYDIYKIYKMGENEVSALNGVSLKINAHEFVAIVGPSGSGKSTLMNIIGCLDTPTSGTYILDGHEVSRLNDNQLAEIRNSKIGFVFQNFNLIPQLTALENVELPLIYKGVPASARHRLAKEALARVGLEHRMHHRPRELSGGQQQRVAIARALVTSPPIILADEPTGNLDSKSGAEIMQIFKELHAQGNTIVLITHDNNIAMQAKRIVRIQDGQIIEDKEVS